MKPFLRVTILASLALLFLAGCWGKPEWQKWLDEYRSVSVQYIDLRNQSLTDSTVDPAAVQDLETRLIALIARSEQAISTCDNAQGLADIHAAVREFQDRMLR